MESTKKAVEELARVLAEVSEKQEESEAELREVRAFLAQLVDILRHRGDLNAGHTRLMEKIALRARAPKRPVVKLSVLDDKESIPSPDVDCASLIPLCKARCCSFKVSLAESDVRSGKLAWDIRDPYILSRADDGFCIYQDRTSGFCGCYDDRPGVCRQYDCREDKRVWLDFESRTPAPMAAAFLGLVRPFGPDES